jgi:orotate phosphoribosyltransferase
MTPTPPEPEHDALVGPEHDALVEIVKNGGLTRFDDPVKLASGAMSREFIDAKRALARGRDLSVACRAIIALAASRNITFTAVGGMTMGADMFSHGVAMLADCEWFVVRKQPKDRGTRQQIEGAVLGSGHKVLMVEDTITTGGSTLTALEVVRATGAEVVLITALVDRGDSAASSFAAAGVPYAPLLTYNDIGIDPVVSPG